MKPPPLPPHAIALALALTLTAAATGSTAQTVHFGGRMGDRALLVIDGTPRTVAVGATVQGVRLVGVDADRAIVELAGAARGGGGGGGVAAGVVRATLALGGSPVDLGGANSSGGGSRIVLTAGSGGHFVTAGSINGRAVRLMVDTGATLVSIGQADADRLGLRYRDGPASVVVNTANGPLPARRALLDVVRVGDVQVYDVDAVVMPVALETILLGNSFLARFQMRRDGDRMTLDRRP